MTLRRATRLTALATLVASLTGTATAASAAAPAAGEAATGRAHYVVGASIADPALGPLPIQRVFRDRIGSAPDRKDVLSFRTWDDAAVHSFVRNAPSGTVLVWMHEPEDEIKSGKYSAAAYANRVIALTDVIRQEGRIGQVHPASILMRWTLDKHSGRAGMLDAMLSPQVLSALRSTGGLLAWDSYGGPNGGRSPQDMYGVPAAWSAAHGLPWAITETGSKQSSPEFWRNAFRYLDTMGNPPRYFLAWNPTDKNGGVFAIQRQPAVAAVWRDQMRLHRP